MRAQRSLFSFAEPTERWVPDTPPDLTGVKDVFLDQETDGLRWWEKDRPIGIAVNGKYLPFRHKGGNLDEAIVKCWAERELRDKDVYAFNAKFEAHMMYAWGIDLEAQGCRLHDVAFSAALLDDHMTRFRLEDISQDWVGQGKVQGLDVTALADYHAKDVAPYAIQDVELNRLLKEKMWPHLVNEELLEVQALEDATIFAVCEMERNAAPLDVEKLDRWVKESERELLALVLEIQQETGVKIRPERPADFAKVFHARKIPIAYYTAGGAPSFTDEILSLYSDPVVKKVQRARRLSSLRSKYLLAYQEVVQSDGRLRYQLHQLRGTHGDGSEGERQAGTITGRFSSSDKNIQQVMSVDKQAERFGGAYVIRDLFIPEPGSLFLSADAAQIEYRIFAAKANSPTLNKAYRENPRTSYHKVVWEMVKPYREDIQYKAVKNLNFAKLYGAGVAKIAGMLGVSEEEAKEFIAAYDTAFPEVRKMLRIASDLAENRGYVKTIAGRRVRFKKGCKCPACTYAGPRYHKALNGAIQGSAADIMKKKLVELHAERKRTGMKMRFTVHDEVNGDVPDMAAARMVDEILNRQSFPLRVPILWETEVGNSWASVKEMAA